ncbi:cell wall protein DAN4-like [Megalobrama amblycephala]|uniref:cell wall protein DAN4-like n=1 Tax=Megalobrama amblycephala TaxID=75352 RepID=UPI0020141DE1|nr:cell wall protein DAN4-like [Megalobrama amblycephala]
MNALWLPLLLSSVIWAEEDYFHISPNATWDSYTFPDRNATWDEARDHCQKCFKELTTITSGNVHLIVRKNASLNYWTGLRRSYNGTVSWSKWSNEDPVTYQNWYPGHPVPNKVKEKMTVCFSTTETPLSTLITTTTSTPVTSTQTSTVTTPVTSPSNKTDGTCPILTEILECLNMVCNMTYNELKDAVHKYTYAIPQAVTPNTTTYSTTPHATTFSTAFNTTTNGSTTESTTASNCILVDKPDSEVYIDDACVVLFSYGMWKEVKCTESHPFICYDVPSAVENLTVVSVMTESILLTWSKPVGDSDFYSVEYRKQNETRTQKSKCKDSNECNVTGLSPGFEYNFTVKAIVNDNIEGVSSSVSDYTKPSKVVNLTSTNDNNTFIKASWKLLAGNHSGYRYCLYESTTCTTCENATNCNTTTRESIEEGGKTDGTKYCLCVAALTNNDILSGEMVGIPAYTRPKTVILSLDVTSKSITASWTIHGNYEKFNVTIETTQISPNYFNFATTNDLNYTFRGLMAAVNYTVTVVTLNGDLESKPATKSKYTVPVSPSWVNATSDKTNIKVTWGAPEDSKNASIDYSVQYGTAFWKEHSEMTTDKTSISFTNLKPGTKYDFNVSVVAGNLTSFPVNASAKTEPEKKTLILTMLCSSQTPLQCERNDTQTDLLKQLNITFTNEFEDLVHWKLKWVERKVNSP